MFSAWGVAWLLSQTRAEANLAALGLGLWLFDVPAVPGFIALYATLVDRILWRLRWGPFSICDMPDLQGTWVGYIQSSRDNFEAEVPSMIYIRQTMSQILVRLEARYSHSVSITACLNTEESANSGLTYVYQNNPDKAYDVETMRAHTGTAHLDISPDAQTMEGNYFNNEQRGYFGRLIGFRKVSRKRLNFAEATAQLPSATVQSAEEG